MSNNNFTRLQFDGFTSSQNNKKTVKRSKYQVTPKAEYSSMDEVVYEYMNNFDTLMEKVEDVVKNNPQIFHPQCPNDGNSYAAVTVPIKMGDGYSVYFGTFWPEKEGAIAVIPIKRFRLKGSKSQNKLGIIVPENCGDESLAVFTEDFLQKVDGLPVCNEGLFFFLSCHSGLLSAHGKDVRWLFDEGMAIGQVFDGFYYFDEFTDTIKFPMGNLTTKEIKNLEMKMWKL